MLVVGAGPAGAELSRLLAIGGIDVLLVDRLTDLARAAFSSAALPLDALERFGLPASVVAARWSSWELLGPGESRRLWCSGQPQGVVLDFAALRRWLVAEARAWGAEVLLGQRLLGWQQNGAAVEVGLQGPDGRRQRIHCDWLVDASGQQRALIGDPPPDGRGRPSLVSGVGLEWLVGVSSGCWQRWSERLAFALGSDWVAQGYGWVFPMQPGHLKVGVCRLLDQDRPQPPLGAVLERLLLRLFDQRERQALQVLDRHGGLIRSTVDRREPHRRGRLLAVGDAVSTANLLGGEGIRHALLSSRVLAPLLLQTIHGRRRPWAAALPALEPLLAPLGERLIPRLARPEAPLAAYPRQLRSALGWRWELSGRLARRTWLGLRDPIGDARLERLLRGLEGCAAEDLGELLFGYRFERYGLRALAYGLGWR